MSEEWRDVVGLEGRYRVSSLGRVRGGPMLRHTARGCNKVQVNPFGYERVSLTGFDQKLRPYWVHRLVAEAFVGPRPAGMQVNHKDGIKRNNAADNLEYCTPGENIRHAVRAGLKRSGEEHHNCILVREQVIKIRRLARDGMSNTEIAKLYGLSHSRVSRVVNRRVWAWLPDVAA